MEIIDRSDPRTPQERPPDPNAKDYNVRLNQYLERQLRALNTLVSGGLRWQNLKSTLVTGMTPDTPNTPFTVPHELEELPVVFIANLDAPGHVWATLEDMALWTTSSLLLRSDAPTATFTLLVM